MKVRIGIVIVALSCMFGCAGTPPIAFLDDSLASTIEGPEKTKAQIIFMRP